MRRSKELTISGTAIGRWHRKVTDEVYSRRLYKSDELATVEIVRRPKELTISGTATEKCHRGRMNLIRLFSASSEKPPSPKGKALSDAVFQ